LKTIHKIKTGMLCPVLTVLAASVLSACGGGGGGGGFAFLPPGDQSGNGTGTTFSGVVSASAFKPGSATDPTISAGYYANATVCVDKNDNGRCDDGEVGTKTDANGKFSLVLPAAAALIADIGTSAKNTATQAAVPTREVLRIRAEQVAEQGSNVVVSPLSAEVARLVDANGSSYAAEKKNLAARIGVSESAVLGDAASASGKAQTALLSESNALNNRFAYATTKLDRGDLFPDALASVGGDPTLGGKLHVSSVTANVPETRKAITFAQSQQAAFNIEGIPRYDHIFIVMLENKASSSIVNSAYAPKINAYLKAGNQLVSYYATGNPSEPNYTALGGADDWGITDDSQWNCDATGANAVQDLPLPDKISMPAQRSSPFNATCMQTAGVNHNIVGKPNLFNAMTAAGLTWRTYSESMNPGQDFRIDSVNDSNVSAKDNVYTPGTVGPNTTTLGDATLTLPLPAGLYKTKHHPGMAYQNVRSAPEWKYSNRTMGGGQWDAALKNSTTYDIPADYDYDQLGTDLASGNVGNLNFLVPDQCDDMHGITVKGTNGAGASVSASDCGSVANNVSATAVSPIITRGDNYVDYTVKRIQASDLWKNPNKRVAIVLMFDEGNATGGFNSCCGWNPLKKNVTSNVPAPLKRNDDGTWSQDTSINNYQSGNRGHGESIFGILSNQPDAPKGISDSDAYSHFSFVRTLQDMFQLADPAIDSSYMNRSKYTEAFVSDNILNLPEYAGSADTHFDSVRPINHAFVAPVSYTQKQSADAALSPQTGPDGSQVNVWSLKQ